MPEVEQQLAHREGVALCSDGHPPDVTLCSCGYVRADYVESVSEVEAVVTVEAERSAKGPTAARPALSSAGAAPETRSVTEQLRQAREELAEQIEQQKKERKPNSQAGLFR